MTWKFHVDDSTKGRNDIILGQYLLTELGLNLKLSEHVTKSGDGTFKGYTTHMVYLSMHIFNDLNTEKLHIKNNLPMINTKRYMIQNMYVLLQNDYI